MTVSSPSAATSRPRLARWVALAAFMAATVALSAISEWRAHHLLLINRTASLPNWAFLVHEGELPKRGEYFAFVPPPSALVARHFGAGREPWAKIAFGAAGDLVAHRGAWVTVDGRVVGHMKARTRFGEPLTPGRTGRVPQGCYYAGTPHPDGFDSRYAEIGFICGSQVVGVAEPIL